MKEFLHDCPKDVRVVMTSRDASAVDELGGTAIDLSELSLEALKRMKTPNKQAIEISSKSGPSNFNRCKAELLPVIKFLDRHVFEVTLSIIIYCRIIIVSIQDIYP